MTPFAQPSFPYVFNLNTEFIALDSHKVTRKIPQKQAGKLLIATWNITNFGLQKRTDDHLQLMAHIIKYFDVVAIQEVADDIRHLEKLMKFVGAGYDILFSDIGGNAERAGYIYDNTKLTQKGLVAELVIKTTQSQVVIVTVGGESVSKEFKDYNRNPYMVNFVAGKFDFTLVNVHLYWTTEYIRELEVKALGNWAKKRSELAEYKRPSKDIILLGDFNMPSFDDDDPYYKSIKKDGFVAPLHETEYTGSNLAGDKVYDQIFFFPKHTKENFSNKIGVFDFDNAVFRTLWADGNTNKETQKKFFQYIRYYLADHRPLWAQFDID